VIPVQHVTTPVLAEILRRQPSSAARTAFAWQIAVGPVLARSTTVVLERGVLRVSARDARWLQEIARAKPVVLSRLQQLLGEDVQRLDLDEA
jgi:hypothetical protein